MSCLHGKLLTNPKKLTGWTATLYYDRGVQHDR
jgi:hypothetical protein